MAEQKDEVKKKTKRPTALKRNMQAVKCNKRNRSFKARVATTLRSFKETLPKNDKAATQAQLNEVFSLLDKGVKKGVFKLNKARRLKEQASALKPN
jgi:small subunit ribosomal protein S20